MALSLAAVAVPPEIGGLMPPQAEEPRVTGRDGKTVDAVLESDGSVQGAG